MHDFLTLIHTLWTVVNAKERFALNPLGNALVKNDEKLGFVLTFANWLSLWCELRSTICLSKQTFDGMIKTLRAQAHLASDILDEGYQYDLPAKFQSDPVVKWFSRYRQMSGGNFLVSLREVINSENILLCRSLQKQNVCIWKKFLLRCQQASENKTLPKGLRKFLIKRKPKTFIYAKKVKLQSRWPVILQKNDKTFAM